MKEHIKELIHYQGMSTGNISIKRDVLEYKKLGLPHNLKMSKYSKIKPTYQHFIKY